MKFCIEDEMVKLPEKCHT